MSELRENLIKALIVSFYKDLSLSLEPFGNDDKIKIIGLLTEYLKGIFNSYPGNDYFEAEEFDEDEFVEKNLLGPYRDKMVPFVKTQLTFYFSKDEFNKTRLFDKLKIKEEILNDEEYTDYIVRIFGLLSHIKKNLYLKPTMSSEISEEEVKQITQVSEEAQEVKNNKLGFSRARQALMIYYALKLMGHDVSPTSSAMTNYARFGHALSCWPYSTIQNSELYKFIRKAPFIKPDNQLIKDLEFVKEQFLLIDNQNGVRMVQEEIDSIERSRNKKI